MRKIFFSVLWSILIGCIGALSFIIGMVVDRYVALIGYTAVVVSLLGNIHPLGVIFASIFFGGLISGMSSVERALQIPETLALLSQGIIIVLILIIQIFAKYEIKMK